MALAFPNNGNSTHLDNLVLVNHLKVLHLGGGVAVNAVDIGRSELIGGCDERSVVRHPFLQPFEPFPSYYKVTFNSSIHQHFE